MGSTNKMYGFLYSSLVSCLCTISCVFDKALHNGTLDEFLDSLKTVDGNPYDSPEEARNIETTEQYAARRHGD